MASLESGHPLLVLAAGARPLGAAKRSWFWAAAF